MTAFPNDKERDVRAHLKRRLKAMSPKGELRKVSWFPRSNAPDELVLIFPGPGQIGRNFLAELKAPGKTPRAGQYREHNTLRNAGVNVVVLDCREAVDRALGVA